MPRPPASIGYDGNTLKGRALLSSPRTVPIVVMRRIKLRLSGEHHEQHPRASQKSLILPDFEIENAFGVYFRRRSNAS